jgi:ribonuclease HII
LPDAPIKPDFSHERRLLAAGMAFVAGVDEVGRGALAGPVAVAAVILDPDDLPEGIDDSKALSKARRQDAFAAILGKALAVAVATANAVEIDALNIRGATLLAMRRAVRGLAIPASFALIDGRDIPPGLVCPAQALINGDAQCLSIAAASIVAKVMRDAMMARLDAAYPDYGFAGHVGYGVPQHLTALKRRGATPLHRLSFAPCRTPG